MSNCTMALTKEMHDWMMEHHPELIKGYELVKPGIFPAFYQWWVHSVVEINGSYLNFVGHIPDRMRTLKSIRTKPAE